MAGAMISEFDAERIDIATSYIKDADELVERADSILGPIVTKVMKTGTIEEIREMVERLPHGFQRSELRTFYIQKLNEALANPTVIAAAIVGHNGKVWSLPAPLRHHDVIKHMAEHGEPTPIDGEQGFILSDGRFVRRKPAAHIAIKAGQTKELKWPPYLYSEDIW